MTRADYSSRNHVSDLTSTTKARLGGGSGAPGATIEAVGGLNDTEIKMSYNAGQTSYANSIKNTFSGTANAHTMSFVVRQNSTDHTLLTLRGDDRIIFGGSPVFNGDVGVNIGQVAPLAAIHAASATITDGPLIAMSYTDTNYRAMIRGTWSGSSMPGNTARFTMRQGVDSTERTVWTARADGALLLTMDPVDNLGAATKQYVDNKSVVVPNEVTISTTQPVDGSEFWVDPTGTPPLNQTAADARYINTAGDTMTGPLVVSGTLEVGTPTISAHAASKGYVDGRIWYGTLAAYNAIGTKDPAVLYVTTG